MNSRPSTKPPPPPPLPRSENLLKLSTSSKFDSQNRISNYIHTPAGIKIATIKPTTAGLLKYPAIEDNCNMQQVSSNDAEYPPSSNLMGTQMFKNELLSKQLKISNASSQSIDDRLKARKEQERNLFGNLDNSNMVQDRHQTNYLPEKLASTLPRDKQPFSYSVDVNDPNNKGKLDLTQIKSPIMRRRLLANMNSAERSDDESESDSEEIHTTTTRVTEANQKPFQRRLESPTIIHYESNRENNNQPVSQEQSAAMSPIIRYNEPPLFYNSINNPGQPAPYAPTNGFNQFSNSNAQSCYIDELNLEVAKSLDSLSMLVANLPGPEVSTTGLQSHERHTRHEINNYQPSQSNRRSTFLPHDYYNGNSTELANRHLSSYTSPEVSHHALKNRSIGDYLLSPNTDYFATSSASLPYSISPFYGSNLEPEICSFSAHSSAKPSSGKTFYPINKNNKSFDNL